MNYKKLRWKAYLNIYMNPTGRSQDLISSVRQSNFCFYLPSVWTFQLPGMYSTLSMSKRSSVVKLSFHLQMFWAWAMILLITFSDSLPNFALKRSSKRILILRLKIFTSLSSSKMNPFTFRLVKFMKMNALFFEEYESKNIPSNKRRTTFN